MALISIQPTFPQFDDADGKSLDEGYIYIGAENLNPQIAENQIEVYWDDALTIAASQPIRTVGGRPSRSGSPARMYIGSNYSMTVRDKQNALVYTALSHPESVSSTITVDSIADMIAITGAFDNQAVDVFSYNTPNYATVSPFDGGGGLFVWDSTQDKANANAITIFDPSVSLANQGTGSGLGCWMRNYDVLTFEMGGAVGDGVTDDTVLMQAVLDLGELNVEGHAENYLISTLTFNIRFQNVHFNGDVTVSGTGLRLAKGNLTVNVNGRIRASVSSGLVAGALSPAPTIASGISVNCANAKISFNSITGFIAGISIIDGEQCQESYFAGTISTCVTAVSLAANTLAVSHEGNVWDLHIFTCENGYIIGSNCKYNEINKVIDNASITSPVSTDIIDNSGFNVITPYFYRGSASQLNGTDYILHKLSGGAQIGIAGSDAATQVLKGSVELYSSTLPYIDIRNVTGQDYDYRIQQTLSTGDFEIKRRGSNATAFGLTQAKSVTGSDGPHATMYTPVYTGAYGSDWSGFTQPTGLTNGTIILAYNTTFPTNSKDHDRLRVFYKSAFGWHKLVTEGELSATTTQLADITHGINTADKYVGKMVWNTTTSKPVWANAATAAGVWKDATGATVHTPV